MMAASSISVDVGPLQDDFKKLVIALSPGCALCHTRCGCIQCGLMLPCTCTKICNKCLSYPCACKTGFTSKWMNEALNSVTGIITNNAQAIVQLSNNIMNYMTINPIVANYGNVKVSTQSCNPGGSTGLVTGPGFFNPNMLSDGTIDQKLARARAVLFRNLMLGEGAKELYSPEGFRIRSKIWPEREYVFYTHHVSCQVYDNGVNIGRLDVHTANDSVPMGDLHLAAMLKVIYDEEGMISSSRFSRVRDI